MRLRRGAPAMVAGLLLGLAVAEAPSPATAQIGAARTARVSVGRPGGADAFAPRVVTISPGDRVEWRYDDGDGSGHSITSQPGQPEAFDSHGLCRREVEGVPGLCMQEGSPPFARTFNRGGSYEIGYYCKIHGRPNANPAQGSCGMCGVVRVVAAPPPTASPTGGGAPTPAGTAGGTPTATPKPGATASPRDGDGGTSPDDELASGDEGNGGAGGRLGLALVFLAVLGVAARSVYRRFILDDLGLRAPPAGPPREHDL